jgi:hypothetical protein
MQMLRFESSERNFSISFRLKKKETSFSKYVLTRFLRSVCLVSRSLCLTIAGKPPKKVFIKQRPKFLFKCGLTDIFLPCLYEFNDTISPFYEEPVRVSSLLEQKFFE